MLTFDFFLGAGVLLALQALTWAAWVTFSVKKTSRFTEELQADMQAEVSEFHRQLSTMEDAWQRQIQHTQDAFRKDFEAMYRDFETLREDAIKQGTASVVSK